MATLGNLSDGTQGSQSGDASCIFCKIAANETETEILCCDDELVCFWDVKPGALHHYLVVPRTHVGNCKSLGREHVPLVERMVQMGKTMLQKNKVTNLDDIRLGFHIPPFSSVPHLHLHVLAPASQMSDRSLRFYGPQSFWFITVDKVLKQLNSKNHIR